MRNSIRRGFLSEGYTQQQVNAYFKQAGEVAFTKPHGRGSVATLNKMIEYLGFLPMVMNNGELYQAAHCHEVNRDLCHAAGLPDYGLPVEFLEADMKRTGIIKKGEIAIEGTSGGRKTVGEPNAERKVSLCDKTDPVLSGRERCGIEME